MCEIQPSILNKQAIDIVEVIEYKVGLIMCKLMRFGIAVVDSGLIAAGSNSRHHIGPAIADHPGIGRAVINLFHNSLQWQG